MSGYKNFAVAGAGNIGVFVVEDLLKQKDAGLIDNVYILTRATSTNSEIPRLTALGAKSVSVDYSSTEALVKTLIPLNLDVFISTLGHVGTALDLQWPLVDAVKAAGIKLFVPSEFGKATEGATAGLFGKKGSLHNVLREKGVNSAYFYTGAFADIIFEEYLDWDLVNGKVEAGGDGNVPLSFTARRDISRYLAYVLTRLPREKIENREFRIEGDRKTFNELFKQYEERKGVFKLTPTYRSEEELARTLKENPQSFSSMLQYSFLTHGGTVGRLDQLNVDEFPGWNPTPAVEFMARQ